MWETDDKQPRKVSADERRVMIVDEVNSRTSIHVADICEHFGISEVTARSDLDKLERAGKLRRTHGGAVSITRTITISYPDQRMNLNVEAKRKVAQCAAELVSNGDSLFVDSGTTTLEFVRLLGSKHDITIVTNDLSIATFADSNLPHADVVLLGGALRKNHRYITGPIANDILGRLYVDKAFMGTDSFDPQQGFATEYTGNAEIKRGMLAHSNRHIVLMDITKLRQPSFISFAGISDFDVIVMDEDPDGTMAQAVESARTHARLVIADEVMRGTHIADEELIGGSQDRPGGRQWMTHIDTNV